MARIRSVHPGLFSDDAFMEASPMARLLIIGLWTEAWDDGVFQWRPKSIKAKVFPGDNVDVVPLLDELEGLSFFHRFISGGKEFAAIRNFRKFQSPRKPNSSGVLPDDLRAYVAIPESVGDPETVEHEASAEQVPYQCGTDTEPVQDQCGNSLPEGEEGRGVVPTPIPKIEETERVSVHEEPTQPTTSEKPKRNQYPTDFEAFWKGYPTDANMSKIEAAKAWTRLSADERAAATGTLPAFRAFCSADPTYRPVHACRYLSQKRFEGHQKTAEKSAASPRVYVMRDTPQWAAWSRYEHETKGKYPPSDRRGGWYFQTEWPPVVVAAAE